MARICIVTPGPLGSNPRVVKEATALTEAGHRVHVISTRVLEQVDQRDKAILQQVGWSSQRVDLRGAYPRKMFRAVQAVAGVANRFTGAFSAHAHSLYQQALSSAVATRTADLFIGHYVAALPLVARAARRTGALYAYDAEDFHLGEHGQKPSGRLTALVRTIEQRLLPDSAYVTAASPGIAAAYVEAYGISAPTVVMNAFPLNQAPSGPTSKGSAAPGPSLYWFSQTIGPDRGLECTIAAIAKAAAAPHLYLRGAIEADYEARLMTLAEQAGVTGRIHLLAPASPLEMERLASVYDLGLAAEPGHSQLNNVAVANKLFSYMLAGVPAVVSDTVGQRLFAQYAPGATFSFPTDDSESLAQVLDALLLDPPRLAAARARAFELGQTRLNWETERSKLLATVERALTQVQP